MRLVEDVKSSMPSEARVHFKDAQDPDAIELLLDPAQLDKPRASGDAASSELESTPSRRRFFRDDGRVRLRLWQRIRRQLREFRFRFARRFSKMFGRRRYDLSDTEVSVDQSASAATAATAD